MTPVLDIDSLLESPFADLHALAGELGIEGYRLLRKSDLTIAILESRGAIADEIRPRVETKATELTALKAERERIAAEREEAEDAAREEAREQAARERRERPAQRTAGQQRSGRGGRSERSSGARESRPARERGGQRTAASGERDSQSQRRDTRGDERARGAKQEPATPEPTVTISGVFEPGSGGGGRLRTDLARRVRGDADVQRGDVRKWRLHRGDVISGDAKKIKRGRTDHQLVRIATVNGQTAEQRQTQSARFADAETAAPVERFAKKLFKHAPVMAGSRVVVTGPTRAAASQMTAQLAAELAATGVSTALVLTVARPEVSTHPAGVYDLVAIEAGKPAEDALPAIELAIERGKRLAESGANAAVLVDGLDLLPSEKAAEIFNSSRNLAAHGSLTVIGSAGAGSALEAQATTIAVVSGGGRRLKLDKKASWSVA
jgi:transcription termination factor Rho